MTERRGPIEAPESAPQKIEPLESFRQVLDAAPTLVAVAGLDGYYKYVNQAFERVLGYTNEEVSRLKEKGVI